MSNGALPQLPPVGHLAVFRAADPNYVALLVEGPGDVEMWRPWVRYYPVPLGGRSAVLAWVTSLRQMGERGYVGVLDADCVRLEGLDERAADLIVSDGHDLECDIFQLPVLERLIASADGLVLANLLGQASLRDALCDRALPFGLLRWHFFRKGVPFEPHSGRLSPNRFLPEATWILDMAALHAESAAVLGVSVQVLEADLAALPIGGVDPWKICNGHDLTTILAVALRGPLELRKKYPQDAAVATALRLAVDSTHLRRLRMWIDLQAWDVANAPLSICVPL